jgi:hypothetical protein
MTTRRRLLVFGLIGDSIGSAEDAGLPAQKEGPEKVTR